MKFFDLISAHPALVLNLAIITLIGLTIWWTGQPLVILALFATLFHGSQQVLPGIGESPNEPGEYDGQGNMGFTQ